VCAKWLPMLSRQASTRKLCMLACTADGGARGEMHEFGCFLRMLSGFVAMLDGFDRLGQRDRSYASVESAISDRWCHAGLRCEPMHRVRWSCSERAYGAC
jgi:hypothetical protein